MTNDVRVAARRLQWAVIGAIGAMVVVFLAASMNLAVGAAHFEYRVHGLTGWPSQVIAGGSVALIGLALVRLTQLLGRIGGGETFSAAVIQRFRGFAFWLLLSALFALFAPVLTRLLTTPAAGVHQVHFVLDFREIVTVGTTLLLFLLARLLEQARGIEDEMREIV
ncbi:MAG: DUF2975 domain-containing protein [Sphingomicrobium sp.]